jgi:hypothetical protein
MSSHRLVCPEEMQMLADALPANVRAVPSTHHKNRTYIFWSVVPGNQRWIRETNGPRASMAYDVRLMMELCRFGSSAALVWDMEPTDLEELAPAIAALAGANPEPAADVAPLTAAFGLIVLLRLQAVDMGLFGASGTGFMHTHDGLEWLQVPTCETYDIAGAAYSAAKVAEMLMGMGFKREEPGAEARIYIGQWKVIGQAREDAPHA